MMKVCLKCQMPNMILDEKGEAMSQSLCRQPLVHKRNCILLEASLSLALLEMANKRFDLQFSAKPHTMKWGLPNFPPPL